MTIAQLVETHRDAYTQAVVEGSGLAANAARTAAEAAHGVAQMRANVALLRDQGATARDRANAEGGTLTDLFLYLAAEARQVAANVLLGATSQLATSAGFDAEAAVYETAAIRTVSEPAANAIEATIEEARAAAEEVRADRAPTTAAAGKGLNYEVVEHQNALDAARDLDGLSDEDILATRRGVYETALSVAEARARLRIARLTGELDAAQAEAEVYAAAQQELAIDPNPWMDPAFDDADL